MIQIELTTPAILFPAISLLFLSYTNRYLALAGRIRHLYSDWQDESLGKNICLEGQIKNLKIRLLYIRWMQITGAISLLLSVTSMCFVIFDYSEVATLVFFVALFLMMVSLVLLVIEASVSGGALKLMLEQATKQQRGNSTQKKGNRED